MSRLLSKVEINCDMGESFGRWKLAPDEEIMPLIDAANVACGFHAGDYTTMRRTVRLAKDHGVKVGSHPGLPDLLGFGRRKMDIAPEEIYNLVLYQTGALKAFLDAEGMKLNHIKPHGELYFYIARDENVMRAVLRAAKVFGVPVVGARNDHYKNVADEYGVELIQEFYVDMDWSPERNLIPMAQGRVKDTSTIKKNIVSCGLDDFTLDINDERLNMDFGEYPFSICLHSDVENALGNIKASREAVDEVNSQKWK